MPNPYRIRPPRKLDMQLPDLPKDVKFCRKCVMSNQRPRIVFDQEGVCNACRHAERKHFVIDWSSRSKELEDLLEKYRSKDGNYDVVVPGSGGKDSAFVAHQLKHRWGMNPLTVTWSPFEYTEIGYKNFRNFCYSGFDNILATPDGQLHRKLGRLAFDCIGDAFLPFTYGITSFAFQIAVKFGIRLVFFGENGEAEYGGNPASENLSGMPVEKWAESYFKGAGIDTLVQEGIETGILDAEESKKAFHLYRPPSMDEIIKSGAEFHWYSYYNKWVPQENYYYCREHTGFEANPEGRSEGTYSKYASLDDKTDGFHYFLGFIKFGFGRAMSDAAHEVRDGHITREEAVALVKRYDGEFPGKYFDHFLEYVDMDADEFWSVVDSWRPEHLWTKDGNEWKLRHAVYYDKDKVDTLPPPSESDSRDRK